MPDVSDRVQLPVPGDCQWQFTCCSCLHDLHMQVCNVPPSLHIVCMAVCWNLLTPTVGECCRLLVHSLTQASEEYSESGAMGSIVMQHIFKVVVIIIYSLLWLKQQFLTTT